MEDEVYSQPNHKENWIIARNGQRNLYRKANLCYSNVLSGYFIYEGSFRLFRPIIHAGGGGGQGAQGFSFSCAMPMSRHADVWGSYSA